MVPALRVRPAFDPVLDLAHSRRQGPRILAYPAVVDPTDGNGVEVVELLPAAAPGYHQAGGLEHAQVPHHAEARHWQALLESSQALPVLTKESVEQSATGGVGEGPEDVVHAEQNT